jgi:RNA polymerase sigma factor (sigma-70 family)
MTATVGSDVAEAGDEVARLYARYAPKLRRFCLGRLRSAEDADDAVQTVFLRVYTALRGGTAPVYEAAWLYKIAHNVCLSRLEARAARARVEQPRDLDELQDVLAAPGERRDELVGLADALAAMPANLRQAILLREWQGLSYAEIAEALGVSVSAVETLIFRARRHLAAALGRGAGMARSLVTLLQLPWLLRRLRSLLLSGRGSQLGVAKLSAVAVLAAGGVGAGVATSVIGAPARVAPSTTAPATVAAVVPRASTALPAAPARAFATPARPIAERRRPASNRTATAVSRPSAPAAATPPPSVAATTTAAAEPRPAVPGPVPRAPAPTPAVPTTASTTATTASPTTTTTAAVPATTVPVPPTSTVAVPAVTVTVPAAVPTVAVPVLPVQVPTVALAPTVVVPTVPAVTVTTPVATVTVPTVAVPTIAVPTLPLP